MLDRCTCGPTWVYEPGCRFPHRDDSMCSFCEDAPFRELLEAHAGDEPVTLAELDEGAQW